MPAPVFFHTNCGLWSLFPLFKSTSDLRVQFNNGENVEEKSLSTDTASSISLHDWKRACNGPSLKIERLIRKLFQHHLN